MWPFKKKIKPADKPKVAEKPNPYDCIYKSIIADLDELNIADWKFEYQDSHWEYFHNTKKNYSLKCYDDGKEGWLVGVHYNNFSMFQQRAIYRKCQNMWQAMQDEKDRIRKERELKEIKSVFPDCFN